MTRAGDAGVENGLSLVSWWSALGLAWEFRRPWFQGNLGVVDPGKVIRSAQPTSQLERLGQGFPDQVHPQLAGRKPGGLVVRRRGADGPASGLAYYDLPLSATRRPTRHELLQLIDVLERCPYPLLIHCKSGADRTGLASALYLMLQRGETPEQAEEAFSLEFGHVPFGGTEHLHEPLDEYAAWLKANGLAHTAERFRAWVKNEYAIDRPSVGPSSLTDRARPAVGGLERASRMSGTPDTGQYSK